VSTSAYYAGFKTPENTDKSKPKEMLETKARHLFYAHQHTYGYRRLAEALPSTSLNGPAGLKGPLSQAF
jgi:hypothetical protein